MHGTILSPDGDRLIFSEFVFQEQTIFYDLIIDHDAFNRRISLSVFLFLFFPFFHSVYFEEFNPLLFPFRCESIVDKLACNIWN